jgi:biopolymer transport protein ExbB
MSKVFHFFFVGYIFFLYLSKFLKSNINSKKTTMKRLFSILTVICLMVFSTTLANASATNLSYDDLPAFIQNDTEAEDASMDQDSTAVEEEPMQEEVQEVAAVEQNEPEQEDLGFHQELKKRFIEGGPTFMAIVLLCLILGLAIAIERIIFLNASTTNSKKLAQKVEDALESGGEDAAKEVCRNTSGPVASIYYQGLDRVDEGIDVAEKSIVAYGGVQMGQLEKNVSWVSLFIALAPMLGFMGTVIGMIKAFDKIEAAGDMQPSLVAGGIKVALLTTVFGLIVAIILQIFYNYIVAKIDSIVNDMEDASITLVDILVAHKNK